MASRGKTGIYSSEYGQFLQQLKKARELAGLTQVEAAKRLKRPQSYVSRYEVGQKKIDLFEMRELCRLYRKPLNFFIDFSL